MLRCWSHYHKALEKALTAMASLDPQVVDGNDTRNTYLPDRVRKFIEYCCTYCIFSHG